MSHIATPQREDILVSYQLSIGIIHICPNFIIAEYNEGVHLSFNKYGEVLDIIDKHFGSKPFGFIANRINAYSMLLTDAHEYKSALPNLAAYAIVYYTELTRKNVELEKRFCLLNRESFDNLQHAINWVQCQVDAAKESS